MNLGLARLCCMTFGHRFVFPKDAWADLSCRRCDWTGPALDIPAPWHEDGDRISLDDLKTKHGLD